MKSLMIMRVKVTNSEYLKSYQDIAPNIIKKYQGKIIARGGEVITHEGPDESRRLVIVEFPSPTKATEFYNSPEYQEAITLRDGAADFEIISVECLE